jgi:hypothetical protein
LNILATVKQNFSQRSWWMNGLLLFCAYMTFIYVPWDLLSKPVSEAQEVWFGFMLTGWAAKATEPLHWLIYGAGTVGFWHMRRWMHPWASLYTGQVAVGMLVWNLLDERGQGFLGGLLSAIPFLVLAWLLWRARSSFSSASTK